MSKPVKIISIMMLLLSSALPVRAAEVGGIFGQGSTQFSVLAGRGYAFNSDYLIVGVGAGYYLLDGVGIGLSYESWSGSGPSINKISPSVQYVPYWDSALRPYVGGFYRHAVISGLPSINSLGVRAGVYFASNSRSVIGAGLAYESYLDCQSAIYSSCNETYPEISIIFSF